MSRTLTSFIGVRREWLVVLSVEQIQKRLQQRLDVLAAVVAELHQEVEQTQHLQRMRTQQQLVAAS